MITAAQLAQSLTCPLPRAQKWIDAINQTLAKYEINTPLRIAHFIAQIGHESERLFYVCEIASGAAYEGRKDLGNIEAGDGVKYKGRGLIQITGRNNYQLLSTALGIDLIKNPAMLETPQYAAMSAGWFWSAHHLNVLADNDLLTQITKAINGSINGLDDRRKILISAKRTIGAI